MVKLTEKGMYLVDGKPCIVIHAEGTVTVNGIVVKIRKS